MASSVLASRQGSFKGAGAEVTISEDGVEYKAVILQNVTDLEIYIKTKQDKGEACTKIENADTTQISRIAEDGDGIKLEFADGVGSIVVNANVAVADKQFQYLALVT